MRDIVLSGTSRTLNDPLSDYYGETTVSTPERRFLIALLERGIRDLITTEAGSKYRKDAIEWFQPPQKKGEYKKKLEYICSFQSICLHLDLNQKQLDHIDTILTAVTKEPKIRIHNVLCRGRSRCIGWNRSTAAISEEFLTLLQDAGNGNGHSKSVSEAKS